MTTPTTTAIIGTTPQELTAAQRLVEYFVIVSCRPRWRQKNCSSATSPTNGSTTNDGTSTDPVLSSLSDHRSNHENDHRLKKNKQQRNHNTSKDNTLKSTGSPQNTIVVTEINSPEKVETIHNSVPRVVSNGSTTGNITMPHYVTADDEYTFQPIISARYPLNDYDDNPLNPMILQFCFPVSDVIVPSLTYELPRVHHFVLTTGRGRNVYGTCLTIMEEFVQWGDTTTCNENTTTTQIESTTHGIEMTVSKSSGVTMYLPKVMCILSSWPYLTAFREYLSQLYRLMSTTDIMTVPMERYICNICKEIPAPPPGAYEIQLDIFNSTIRLWAPPAKLPIAYVALPYNILFECLELDNVLFVWRAMLVERKILLLSTQHSILTVCSEILCSLLFPLRWSSLYAPLLPRMLCPILDAPVPYLCGIVRDNWLHAQQFLPSDCIIVDLDYNRIQVGIDVTPVPSPPLRKYGKLQTALVDSVGHVFWQARGVEDEYKEIISKKPPKRSFQKLRQACKDSSQWKERMSGQDRAFTLAYTPDSPNLGIGTEALAGPSKWDLVQESFLRFFAALLKGYQKFLYNVPPSALLNSDGGGNGIVCNSDATKPPISPSGQSNESSFPSSSPCNKWPRFDSTAFIARTKMDSVPFLQELFTTQQFDDFINRRLYNSHDADLEFFDQTIDAKLNRSKLKIKKLRTPLLHSAKVHKDLKKLKALPPNMEGIVDDDADTIHGGTPPTKRFLYKSLPAKFDETLFTEPRPIPSMIAAEFDRQAVLASKLRGNNNKTYTNSIIGSDNNHALVVGEDSGVDDTNDDVLDFCIGEYDQSPEVGAFTTFLFVYCSYVGTDWQKFIQKRKQQQQEVFLNKEQTAITTTMVITNSMEENRDEIEVGETVSQCTNTDTSKYVSSIDSCLNDLTFGVVETCPGTNSGFGMKFPLFYIGRDCNNSHTKTTENAHFQSLVQEEKLIQHTFQNVNNNDDDNDAVVEYEEAREVAFAQLDLSFETLATMTLRGLFADTDSYLSLMEACARCGDTNRALQLIELMKNDGLVVDGHILACYMESFAHEGDGIFIKNSCVHVEENDLENTLNTYEEKSVSDFFLQSSSGSLRLSTKQPDSPILCSNVSTEDNSVCETIESEKSLDSSIIQYWFPKKFGCTTKKKRIYPRRKPKLKRSDMASTAMFTQQLEMGEKLIDLVYQDLDIDTNNDSCPHCSRGLSENDIVHGWSPCAFQDYTTQCPECHHRFVPRFVVSCSTPGFQGSQGPNTPLFCEFLSPWVLRKEFHTIIKKHEGGIERVLDPVWRSGNDIQATLFWNFMILCRRYKLPFSFLLQGHFHNRLILPRRPDAV